jgi:ABC-type nitrate/sulfonate/bicarbonate transport system substrate-binding protein
METSSRNRFIAIAAAIGVVAVTAIVVYRSRPQSNPISDRTGNSAEKPTTVRIGYLNITASLPLFIAEEKDFFTEEQLKHESVVTATSNQLVDALIAGNLDLFIEASAVPVLAVELQSPGRVKIFSVSSITKKAPFDALLVKEDSQIKELSDLVGKKIGVFPGSTATNLLKKYLSDSGVDVSGITFIPMPPQNHLAALVEGSIDALHAYEPTTAIALNKGGVRQLYGSVYADMLDPNPQGVAAVSSKFFHEHPQAAKKAIHALEQAMVFMNDNDAESREILAKRMKLDKAVADRSVFLYMLPHKQINQGTVQKYADMLTELGELKGRVKVEGLLYHE